MATTAQVVTEGIKEIEAGGLPVLSSLLPRSGAAVARICGQLFWSHRDLCSSPIAGRRMCTDVVSQQPQGVHSPSVFQVSRAGEGKHFLLLKLLPEF